MEEAGIPINEVDTVITELQTLLRPTRDRIERTTPTISEARTMKTAIVSNRMDISRKVLEIRARYQTAEETPAQSKEIYMSWRNLLGSHRITSPDDLKSIIDAMQRHIYSELEQNHIVIID